MVHPLETGEGVYIDLRSIPISMAGLFGGWPAALVAGLIAGTFRLFAGGAGALAGIAVISLAGMLGTAFNIWLRGKLPHFRDLAIFCAILAFGDVLIIQTLPENPEIAALQSAPIRWVATVFLTALLASSAVVAEVRRRADTQILKLYEAAFQALPEPLNVKDPNGRFVLANPATAALMKARSSEELIGHTDRDFYPENVATGLLAVEAEAVAKGAAKVVEQQISFDDGRETMTLSTLKVPFYAPAGNLIGVITHNRDITEKMHLLKALENSEKQIKAALDNMADGLIMFDAQLVVVMCNEQYRAMFPLTQDLRVPGTPARAILEASVARGELSGIPSTQVSAFIDNAMSRLRQAGTVEFPLFDGRWVESRTTPLADGGCLVVCSDITRSKQHAQELRSLNDRLEEMAMTDGLTQLLNRRAFDSCLSAELSRLAEANAELSLLLVDVDHFKSFNDSYGHAAGDECLKEVASIVRSVARRPGDRAARYGGEEMAVILPNASASSALAIAEDLRRRVRDRNIEHVGSERGSVTVSVGVATLEAHAPAVAPAQFVNLADEALYRAKASGRDSVCGPANEHKSIKTLADVAKGIRRR